MQTPHSEPTASDSEAPGQESWESGIYQAFWMIQRRDSNT